MELTKNNSCHSQLSYNVERNIVKGMTYLNWKANRKEHMEEALYNLLSENISLLFVSFSRFHETFALN